MALIGVVEAGGRAGMTREGIRRALQTGGVQLVRIGARTLAVEEANLEAFLSERPAGYKGRGRPPGAKNKTGGVPCP